MRIEKKIKELIANEDKKNPLSDQQLALKLNVNRCQVTIIRQKLNIESSKDRLKPFLIKEIHAIRERQAIVSIRELIRILQEKGYNVSRYLVNQEMKKMKILSFKKTEEIGNKKKINATIKTLFKQ